MKNNGFWQNTKSAIKAQKTNYEKLTQKIGVPLSTFQNWISRGITPPADIAVKIALALNTNVETLVLGKSENARQAELKNEIMASLASIAQALNGLM